MAYKRPVRILFIASKNALLAERATEITTELAACNPPVEVRHHCGYQLHPDLSWPDLIITLDVHARDCCPTPPAHVQTRHWALADIIDDQELKERVSGMLGGLRLWHKQ